MTTSTIAGTTDTSKGLHSNRDEAWDVNTKVAARLGLALMLADRGPKWVSKKLGISKRRAKMLVNGETVLFVCDLMILAQALEVSVGDFFEGIELHDTGQPAVALVDDGEDG